MFGEYNAITLQQNIDVNIERGVYDKEILELYTEEEIATLGRYIHHKRDENFTYAGLRQVVDKYLVPRSKQQGRFLKLRSLCI